MEATLHDHQLLVKVQQAAVGIDSTAVLSAGPADQQAALELAAAGPADQRLMLRLTAFQKAQVEVELALRQEFRFLLYQTGRLCPT
jgi:hypothetical protein